MSPLLLALLGGTTALFVSFAITPLTSRLARRVGILDVPDEDLAGRKQHSEATPYLGGVAILCGFAIAIVMLSPTFEQHEELLEIGLFLAMGVALSLMGLADDVRPLPRVVKVAGQLGAALVAWAVGFRVGVTSIESVDLLLTLVWFVGITNAINLMDNMDGLSSGVAGIAAACFATMAVIEGLSVLSLVAAGLAGASFGFLIHNRFPAKVFMGDAGSLLLGYLLAGIGVRLKFDNLIEVTFLVPVVVLGLPIFDTTLVVLSRLRRRTSPFMGGRDHVSHRLQRIGLPVGAAVGLLYFSALCLGWLGIVISRANVQVGWMLLALVIALGIFFGMLLWEVPVYERPQRRAEDR